MLVCGWVFVSVSVTVWAMFADAYSQCTIWPSAGWLICLRRQTQSKVYLDGEIEGSFFSQSFGHITIFPFFFARRTSSSLAVAINILALFCFIIFIVIVSPNSVWLFTIYVDYFYGAVAWWPVSPSYQKQETKARQYVNIWHSLARCLVFVFNV